MYMHTLCMYIDCTHTLAQYAHVEKELYMYTVIHCGYVITYSLFEFFHTMTGRAFMHYCTFVELNTSLIPQDPCTYGLDLVQICDMIITTYMYRITHHSLTYTL